MGVLKQHSVVSGVAGNSEADGYNKYNFVCRECISFIANDSEDHSMLVNFDDPVGQGGTFKLLAGESISDLRVGCKELYVRGIEGSVIFRAVGY